MPCDLPTNHGHRQFAKGDSNTKNAGRKERNHEGVMKRRKTRTTKDTTNAFAAQTSNRQQQQAIATSAMTDAQTRFGTNPIQNSNSSSDSQFLQVHLQILKTLYRTGNDVDVNEQQRPPQQPPIDDDDTVDDEQWTSIQNLLQDRGGMKVTSHQVQRMTGIHQEALLFQRQMIQALDAEIADTDQTELQEEKKQKYIGSPSKCKSSPKMTTITNEVQPLKNSLLGTDLSTSVTPKKSGGRHKKVAFSASAQKKEKSLNGSIMDDVKNNNNNNIGMAGSSPQNKDSDFDLDQPIPPIHTMYNTCGIVSTLLKRKHDCVSENWKKQMEPYQALMNDISTRMSMLKTKLDSLDKSSMTAPAAAAEEAQESRVCIEMKLQLWKMLYQDLIATGTGN